MTVPYTTYDGSPIREFAFEQITVANAAGGIGPTLATFSPANTQPAQYARILVETAPVRYRTDGTAPSATVGELLNPGDVIEVWGVVDITAILFIRTTATSATLDVSYGH